VAILFEKARAFGLRIATGLVVSDRGLRPELLHTPERAYAESVDLIRRFHGSRRSLYAVTPRFALSASEAILDVCRTLLRENPTVRFQTHLNENAREIENVRELFPRSANYLDVYDGFDLVEPRSVFAHSVHSTAPELERMAAAGCSVAHCPASNAALGSGIFPFAAHLDAGVRIALGTDVGGGTGFGILKECLQAYLMQRVAERPTLLTAPQLLYLATAAGAEALGLAAEVGDFSVGKEADFVYIDPPAHSSLAAVMRNAPDPDRLLASVIGLARAQALCETWVEGQMVYRNPAAARADR
jgi:guanine deaminase